MTGANSGTDETRGGCGLDVAAYALGALDPSEAEAFAEHMAGCAMCREELAEFEAVVGVLPISVPHHAAPAALRRRVLHVVTAEARASAAPEPERRQAPRRRWFTMPSPALALGAMAAVIAVAVFGGLQLGSSGSPTSHVYKAQVFNSTGTAEVTVTGGHAQLVVHHFQPPPAGQTYEVWLARPHRPLQPTTALFTPNSHGEGDAVVSGNLHGVSAVMVTPEPAGGSPTPTHSPVIRANLT